MFSTYGWACRLTCQWFSSAFCPFTGPSTWWESTHTALPTLPQPHPLPPLSSKLCPVSLWPSSCAGPSLCKHQIARGLDWSSQHALRWEMGALFWLLCGMCPDQVPLAPRFNFFTCALERRTPYIPDPVAEEVRRK